MHFEHPYLLLLLGAVPGFAAAFAWGDRKRRAARVRFASPAAVEVDVRWRRSKRMCVLAAAVSLIVGLARPVWKEADAPTENTGDVVFLLDVSRSMLSADVPPTRLARAKSIIAGLAKQLRGERTALVAFAGVPSVQCPLTVDEAFFNTMLERASAESVARGGTRIGDAIQFSLDSVFDNVVRARKQLVLVTDGGDQDSFPAIAARAALSAGVRVLVIGVGDEVTGALVPTSASDATPILYYGEQVRTKLEPGVLQGIATAGAGVYIDAAAFDAGGIYQRFMATAQTARSHAGEGSPAASWLVLFGAALLMVETVLSDRKARAAALAVILVADLSAQTAAEWFATGNDAYRESNWAKAISSYEMAARSTPVPARTYFNMGMAYYRERGYANASEAFEKAAVASRGTALEAASKLGLANCAFREAMDAPPDEAQQMLRRVLRSYEELSANADAKFNADVVRRRLAELRERESRAAPPMPSAHKKATGAHDIVEQGGVPEKTKAERVERDW